MRTVGVILAGGRSRRMGGGDKFLREVAGARLIDRAFIAFSPQVDCLVISTARGRQIDVPGARVVEDILEDAGPLAGVHASMTWTQQSVAADAVIVTLPADTPFVPSDLSRRLIEAMDEQRADVAVATSRGRTHHAVAAWRCSLADDLGEWLKMPENRAIEAFLHRQRTAVVEFEGEPDPFFNVNTPEDLVEAQRLAGRLPATQAILGIAGWKNSGKTTLTERLVAELTSRNFVISTVKHAHHDADVDEEGTDSFRHRRAGAKEVALVTGRRWALMHELAGDAEPPLSDILGRLSPVDLVIVEGFKREQIPKIEVRRADADAQARLPIESGVIAIAGETSSPPEDLPSFLLDDIAGIADFVVVMHFALWRGGKKQ